MKFFMHYFQKTILSLNLKFKQHYMNSGTYMYTYGIRNMFFFHHVHTSCEKTALSTSLQGDGNGARLTITIVYKEN